MKTQYKISLFRVITNSTASVISILLLILFFPPISKNYISSNYTYVLVSSITIELGLLAFLIIHNYKEYKYSYFYIDDEKVVYHSFFKNKNNDTIYFKDITNIEIKSLNVIIQDKNNQKLILEYVSRPKEIEKLIKQKMKD